MRTVATEIDLPPFASILTPVHPAGATQYTPDKDLQALCWLAQRTSGNIVELGCHAGFTTANLAWHNPRKLVYGFDWIGGVETMHPSQRNERPQKVDQIGSAAERYPNARCANALSSSVDYGRMDNVTMVFIDADHTYRGTKRDTEHALEHLESLPASQTRYLVWHDYATEYMTGHPDWLQVGHYVRAELAPRYQINFVRETTVAWIEWLGRPRVAIGAVTFNRLDLLKRCLPTWLAQGVPVLVFDNGSSADAKKWISEQCVELISSDQNQGIAVGRNTLLRACRGRFDYVLLIDSDIELGDGCLRHMVTTAEQSPSAAFVVAPFAIRQHMVDRFGRLGEASGECMLTRMSAIPEIGLFPEVVRYYSSDSWLMTLATMQGWWTVVCPTAEYIHHRHSSQANPGVIPAGATDTALWAYRDAAIDRYCSARAASGKYGPLPFL